MLPTTTNTITTTTTMKPTDFSYSADHMFGNSAPAQTYVLTASYLKRSACWHILHCLLIGQAYEIIHLEITTWQKNGGE